MDNSSWQELERIFQAAMDLPPDGRQAFVERECAGRPALQAEVLDLLDASGANIIEAAIQDAAVSLSQVEPFAAGQRIGPYTLKETLGRGGMGQVFRAAREDGEFQQEVAIKVLRPEAAPGGELASRFLAERRILATLEHPYIARLIDGGTDRGQPYLIMEYAREGLPLDQFIKERKLSTTDKLHLFLKICEAVQHAHQRLIVHRDLKPANILVLPDGSPKLLDFGIAKLLEIQPAQAPLTATGWMMLTPDYASPEQVAGDTITVSSDVYSLGVVLFEMLTGERPYRIKSYAPTEIHQAVCSAAVPAPSSVVTRASRLYRQLTGDLDNIILMALRKEPQRRYSSVEQLAADVRAHLEGLPVIARRETFGYYASKFIRRNKMAVGALTIGVLALMVGTSVAIVQARHAEARFRQVRQLTSRFLFDFDEKIRNLEGATAARESLVKTASEYLDSLAAEAGHDRELRTELAIAYRKLGEVQGGPRTASMGRGQDALVSYRKSVELGRGLFDAGVRDPALLEQMIDAERMLGLLETRLGVRGGPTYKDRLIEAIQLAEPLLQQRHDLSSLRILASLYRELGEFFGDTNHGTLTEQRYAQAYPIYKEIQKLAPGPRSDRGVAMITGRLGDAKLMLGDLDSALGLYRDSLAIHTRLASAPSAGVAEQRGVLAAELSLGAIHGDPSIPNLQQYEDASAHTSAAVAIAQRLETADSKNRTAQIDLAYSLAQLGRVLRSTKPAEGVSHLRRAVELAQQVLAASPEDSVYIGHQLRYRTELGLALAANQQQREAIDTLESTVHDFDKLKAPASGLKLIGAEARRELARLIYPSRPADAKRYVDGARLIEPYLLERLDNLDMVDELSSLYEVASLFDPTYRDKARQLWLDWSGRGRSSTFDRRRLQELRSLTAPR